MRLEMRQRKYIVTIGGSVWVDTTVAVMAKSDEGELVPILWARARRYEGMTFPRRRPWIASL